MKPKTSWIIISLLTIIISLIMFLIIKKEYSKTPEKYSSRNETIEFQSSMPKIFPYSVIPGGIQTTKGFQQEVESDYLVKNHYKDFNFSRAGFFTATKGEEFHASYRIDNKIYWTKNKVKIKEGELLLSDGFYLIRARCGNRLAKVPLGPIHPREPNLEPEEEINPSGGKSNFKEPELFETETPKKQEFEIEKESNKKSFYNTEIKEIFFETERNFYDCKDCCDEPEKPSQPVPGPPSLFCLAAGLIGIIYFKRKK